MRRALIIAVVVLIIATWLLTTGDARRDAVVGEPTRVFHLLAPGFDGVRIGVRINVQVEGSVTPHKIRIDTTTRPRPR